MKTTIKDLNKNSVFIKDNIWYKKLNEYDNVCLSLSQFKVFTFFKNNTEVEIKNEPKGFFNRKPVNKQG